MTTNTKNSLIAAIGFSVAMASVSALAYFATPRTYLADLNDRVKLAEIVPKSFGGWQIDNSILPIPPSPDVQEVLDKTYDETLSLTYRNSSGQRIMLSMAYGRNQHRGMNTHRPEICYPAQGFRLLSSPQRSEMSFEGHKINLTRVVAGAGSRNEPITYWLVIGNETTYFGYLQRWASIRYGMRGVIPDGVLVRLSSIDANNQEAFKLQEKFAREFLANIPPSQLHRVVGDLKERS